MLSSFKDKPDAQEIICNNPTAGRENITQRVVYPVEVHLSGKELGKISAENLKASYFYNSAEPSRNDEEQNLFLAY